MWYNVCSFADILSAPENTDFTEAETLYRLSLNPHALKRCLAGGARPVTVHGRRHGVRSGVQLALQRRRSRSLPRSLRLGAPGGTWGTETVTCGFPARAPCCLRGSCVLSAQDIPGKETSPSKLAMASGRYTELHALSISLPGLRVRSAMPGVTSPRFFQGSCLQTSAPHCRWLHGEVDTGRHGRHRVGGPPGGRAAAGGGTTWCRGHALLEDTVNSRPCSQ